METPKYEVVVGNVGTVYSGNNAVEANRTFREYVAQSRLSIGRAAGEDVTLLRNGEPAREHTGTQAEEDVAEAPVKVRMTVEVELPAGSNRKINSWRTAEVVAKALAEAGVKATVSNPSYL